MPGRTTLAAVSLLLSFVGCGGQGQRQRQEETQNLDCIVIVPPPGELLVDDFEDGDTTVASVGILQGAWYVNNDATGTQAPDPRDAAAAASLIVRDADSAEQTWALHTSGGGFTRWGAFAAARLNGAGSRACGVDLSGYDSLSVRVRGEGSLRANVGTAATTPVADGGDCKTGACSDYGISVQLGPEWRSLAIPFADLTQPDWADPAAFEPATSLRVSFWADRSDFDFWVDDIRFLP